MTVRIVFPLPEKVIGLGIVASGVSEKGARVAVGITVKNEVGKFVATGIDVAMDEHEANIAIMRNAVLIALVFIFRKSLRETAQLGLNQTISYIIIRLGSYTVWLSGE